MGAAKVDALMRQMASVDSVCRNTDVLLWGGGLGKGPIATVGAAEQGIGHVIVGDAFSLFVPLQLLAEHAGGGGEMSDGSGTVSGVYRRDGLATGLDAVQEVAHVVAFGTKPEIVGTEFYVQQLFVIRVNLPAGNIDPIAVVTEKLGAGVVVIAEDFGHRTHAAEGHRDASLVGEFGTVRSGAIVEITFHR